MRSGESSLLWLKSVRLPENFSHWMRKSPNVFLRVSLMLLFSVYVWSIHMLKIDTNSLVT